ncbi:MAG: hypothetical protein ABW352_16450 [Polyangiales bacterium]
MGPLARFATPLLLLVACADDPPFLSLSTLCDDLAEDYCDARANGCCPGVDPDPGTCRMPEVERCKTQLQALTAEAALDYDSVEAADKRRAARVVTDRCGAPPTLASFFTGGLADGAPCERDAQCSGGRCTPDTRVCAQTPRTLCPTP